MISVLIIFDSKMCKHQRYLLRRFTLERVIEGVGFELCSTFTNLNKRMIT